LAIGVADVSYRQWSDSPAPAYCCDFLDPSLGIRSTLRIKRRGDSASMRVGERGSTAIGIPNDVAISTQKCMREIMRL
jgi:hypothetical protein